MHYVLVLILQLVLVLQLHYFTITANNVFIYHDLKKYLLITKAFANITLLSPTRKLTILSTLFCLANEYKVLVGINMLVAIINPPVRQLRKIV